MLVESIALAIFVISFGGVIFLLAKKVPVLATMPKNGGTGIKKHRIVLDTENKLKSLTSFFIDGKLLHKFLSWLKCQIIKFETRVDGALRGLRKKAKEDKLNGKK